jgi:hexosaminidase
MFKKVLYGLGAIVVVLAVGSVAFYFLYLKPAPKPISDEDRAAITVMPLPASLKLTGSSFLLNDDFGISIQGPSDSLVLYASLRFKDRLAQLSGRFYTENGNGLIIRFDSATHTIQPVVTDESYQLTITTKGMELRANSGYGVLRGIETLVQLIEKSENKITWPSAVITDEPRYPWRGLMIDACRHWIPKEVILRNIDAMAAVKMNVLHWHLSEYQAFRVESKVFPKLHELGSDGNYYTQEDVREVVAYAHLRGIRVIPEFDMPGHTSSFLVGYPELAAAPGPYQLEKGFGIFTPVMDPTREEVYAFIDRFIGEMVTLFPDPYFHIGGDEVNFTDWDNNASIQAFMKKNNIANNHDLQAYFNQRLEKILVKYNKKMVGWDEILNPNLGKEIVVQSWRSHKSLFEAVQQGRKAILSSGYYLDHKLPAARHYSVDPEVMPGAVTIQPDSLHWQQYDITIRISDNNVNTSLILYGESDNLRGLFYMMDNATSFERATLTDSQLNFSFTAEFGTIHLTSTLSGDSISGEMSLGLLGFPFRGSKTGGHDVAGTRPPKVEQVIPLRDDERVRILGGEAAMWTEAVTAENIDSRIWPRTAAMAEKWWSPATLTQDIRDMYRRLEVLSGCLEMLGLEHNIGPDRIMQDLAQGQDVQAVKTLIDVLEEVKYYERLTMEITTQTPMNEVVDAAQPESLTAVKFTFCVDGYLANTADGSCTREIRSWLARWRDNHERFMRVAEGNSRLRKVMPLSEALYILANASLLAMDVREGKVQLTESEMKELSQAKELQVSPQASVLLAVAEPLKRLIGVVND